jgi:predicted ArsR family transcriptional regulator
MLRYQENNELHRDFHGTTNTTLNYIAEHYGEEALKTILRKTGHDVYKSIREKLEKGDASELIEHLTWFFHREGAEFNLSVRENEIRFECLECPAHKHLKKLGLKISPFSCLQTLEVNKGMCEGTPWVASVEHLGDDHCVQVFRKKAAR